MIIVWSPEATDDLDEAIAYIAVDGPLAAEKLALGVLTLVERLANEPLDGPQVLLETGETVRGWPYPPFRIYYQRTVDTLLVIRVYHQKRKPIER